MAGTLNEGTSVTSVDNAATKKNKKLVVVLLLGILFFITFIVICFCLDIIHIPFFQDLQNNSQEFVISTEKSAVIHYGDSVYYIASDIVTKLDDKDLAEPLRYIDNVDKNNEKDSRRSYLECGSFDEYAFDGDTIYCQIRTDKTRELVKFNFSGDILVKDIWVNNEQLNNSVVGFGKKHDTTHSGYSGTMTDFCPYGDYIYFLSNPGNAGIEEEQDIGFRIGKIKKDGSSIEFVGDHIASEYTVKDGWIYFYDNGYTYDESIRWKYRIDSERAGIYKMRCDGTQRQLLIRGFVPNENAQSNNMDLFNDWCNKMNVFGEYIYFIDYSEGGKSRVCRMNLDGGDFEYVSQNGAFSYTVDCENDVLYYSEGKLNRSTDEPRNIYKVDMSEKKERMLFECQIRDDFEFNCYDNYLYFKCDSFSLGDKKDKPRLAGMRYDLKKEQMDCLYGYCTQELVLKGDMYEKHFNAPNLYWVKDNDKTNIEGERE